jgi:hypothetical protein
MLLMILCIESYITDDSPAAEAATPDQKIILMDKGVPYSLELDEDGVPILPPNEKKSLPEIKQIIRSFLTLNYRMFLILFRDVPLMNRVYSGHAADNNKVSVPWNVVCNKAEKFFDVIYLPAGVELKEISKMKSDTLQACYAHWYTRQENGQRAFLFKSVDPGDIRSPQKKRKQKAAKYSDFDDDEPVPHTEASTDPEPDAK